MTADRPVLPAALRPTLGVAALLGTFVAVVLGVLTSTGVGLGGFDAEPPGEGIQSSWRSVALAIDFGGEPLGAAVLTVALVVACLLLRWWRAAVLAVAAAGVAVTVTTLLKPVVGRTIHGEFLSFPSGHTALATALALVTALLVVDRLRLGPLAGAVVLLTAAVVAAAAMAWAQVSLGAHYPTDTIGGFCVAVAVVAATAWLLDLLADRMVTAA